ncbi:acyl-CoA dehydrogenase family protein [Amphiplicatus metriothermophilus]|uniref:Acyl-CoA dehydrogenase n=1 Tax=Amphiplicatus metriothermophilus TaxID=1519374 RepID=A0A239PK82_9PROT|nr:acyl-CoA dehydrogenase [Amphiplicatus metriothermophilus]MBB5517443.1 acyl-CoA dehydrogenase [Amphiplicatus metriothermophilus]SNT68222.1 acyl-CoA dehydrogenase [Amphiplicatus metriothermophilus]
MPLVLTEEQEMLRDAARGFLEAKAPVSALRKLRDARDEVGFSRDLWKEMAEMGWAGVLVEEAFGGSDFGFAGAGVLAEEMGRTLTASPFLSTSILAATALKKYACEAHRQEYLPKIAAGDLVMALAVDEKNKHAPAKTALRAEKSGNAFRLSGEKTFVADGHVADKLIVAARTAGAPGEEAGITLFLVDAQAKGVARERTIMVDSRNAARVRFDGVEATGDDVVGEIDGGWRALEGVLNAGRAGLAAEMSGSAQRAFEMTVGYLKERTQFGRPIGAFQALQHRAAHLYCELELARSAALKALQVLDESFEAAGAFCSLAKAKAGAVARLASQEAIQMHGGIGMTDEHDIGLYMKRIRVAQEMFGDPAFHADRIARLRGY